MAHNIRRFSTFIQKNSPLVNLQKDMKPLLGNFGDYILPLTFKKYNTKDVVINARKPDFLTIFDVSHMGVFELSVANKDRTIMPLNNTDNYLNCVLEKLFPLNLRVLKNNKSCLSVILNNKSHVIDDFIVSNINNDRYRFIINGNTKMLFREYINIGINNLYKNDIHLLNETIINFEEKCKIILAIQGKGSQKLLEDIFNINLDNLYFMENTIINNSQNNNTLVERDIEISRCGYTGEDGFELYLDIKDGRLLYEKILNIAKNNSSVQLGGLIERDILRLEAGLCLSGNEFSEGSLIHFNDTNLNFIIGKRRRKEKGFIGEIYINEKPSFIRCGFECSRPIKINEKIYTNYRNMYEKNIGFITSSTKSYNLNKFIGMGYISKEMYDENINNNIFDNNLYMLNNEKKVDIKIHNLPFIKSNYYIRPKK